MNETAALPRIMYDKAIETYIRALLDIVTTLEHHHEARTAFAPQFLFRAISDGFLQTVTEQDKARVLAMPASEECLLWQGVISEMKRNWNAIAWVFPFSKPAEMEESYEVITRADLSAKSWGGLRQFWLSCRQRVQEAPIQIPTNIVKIRLGGEEFLRAMALLYQYPPNLRYMVKALLDRTAPSSYLRQHLTVNVVVGEKLEPYAQVPK